MDHLFPFPSFFLQLLVNDMAAINVDAATLARVVHSKDEMVEFSNGM
jgi:hypothetical protein